MPQDTCIALFLMGELVAALRANDPDAIRGLLSGGVLDLGKPVAENKYRLSYLLGMNNMESKQASHVSFKELKASSFNVFFIVFWLTSCRLHPTGLWSNIKRIAIPMAEEYKRNKAFSEN